MNRFSRVVEAVKKLKNLIAPAKKALKSAFGEMNFQWSPPDWLKVGTQKSIHHIRTHRRQSLIAAGALIVTSVGAYFFHRWWVNRPIPAYVEYNLQLPTAPSDDETKPYSKFKITFKSSVAALKHSAVIEKEMATLSPEFPGVWTWNNDREIQFVPTKEWPIGKKFTVNLSKKIFLPEALLKEYQFDFKTPAFRAEITKSEFYQKPDDRKQKQIVINLRFTHPVDPDSFKDSVGLSYEKDNQKIPYTISYGKKNLEAYITSENLKIPEKDSIALFEIEKGYHALGGGNDQEETLKGKIEIPGIQNYFKVVGTDIRLVENDKLESEQVISVNLSDDIMESDFKSNIQIKLLADKKNNGGGIIHFTSAGELTPQDLKDARDIAIDLIPNEREYSKNFNFKIQQPVGKTILVTINKGIKSLGDYVTPVEYKEVLTVPPYPTLLKIQQTGGILSMAGEKKLSIVSRGVEKYRLAISRVIPSEVSNLISQTSGKFTDPHFVNQYRMNFENVAEEFKEDHDINSDDDAKESAMSGKIHYSAIDLGKYLHKGGAHAQGLFQVRLFRLRTEAGSEEESEDHSTQDTRFILISDLGMIVKKNKNNSREIFVQSFHNGGPVSGAKIEVLGKNGLSVLSTTTDGSGHVSIPDLSDFRHEKEPIAFTAKFQNDYSFIPADVRDRAISLSRFDIGGEENATESDKLDAFLFSERGIYRPGDEINIGYIVKSRNWSKNTDGIPIETVLRDARGLTVFKNRVELNREGFGSFRYQNADTAPTGAYQAELYLIEKDDDDAKKEKRTLLGSTSVKVEDFVPDSMKISAHLSSEKVDGWVNPEGLKGMVSLRNLYGMAAIEHKVKAGFTLTPAFPKTNQFKEYRFYDPKLDQKSYSERLDEKETDEKGEVDYDLNLERFESGNYRLSFEAEGFGKEGARSVGARSSVIVSPLPYILGYKSQNNLEYLKKASKASIHILALNPDLKPVKTSDLHFYVQESRSLSVLTRDGDGTYRYQSARKIIPVSEKKVGIKENGLNFELPTGQPGDFQVIAKNSNDPNAKAIFKMEFSVIGETNVLKTRERNSELQIKLGKTDYEAGEEIELQITAPYTGGGLITIEREKVLASKWFKTESTNSVQRIRVPTSLEGNAYVHVSFVRSLNSKEIFTSPLSYGVVPFSVSRKKREIKVTLDTPERVKPGETINISYKTDKKSKIVVFGVDEGILQVANYSKPDPLPHFFRKKTLEVQTMQLLDLLLPEFSILKSLSASGGDNDGALGKNLNPFKRKTDKPVVYWSEIIDSGPIAKKLSYTVPDYFNGQIHFFAVAVSDSGAGVTDDSTQVRGDFIISPIAPAFVTPNDEFDVSVTIANNLEGSGATGSVELEVKPSSAIQLIGEGRTKIQITEGREGVAHFKFKTLDQVGTAQLAFKAGIGQKTSQYRMEISVRPASFYTTSLTVGSLKDDQIEIDTSRKVYPDFAKKSISIAPVPLALSQGLVQYLSLYPHGCTEQILSKAFPILVLKNRKDFAKLTEEHKKNLDEIISFLRTRQSAEGGFTTWPGSHTVNEFYTAYALHFILEAQDRGYSFPVEIRSRTINYIKNIALEKSLDGLGDARLRAYELYLLARAGEVRNNDLVSLRETLEKKHKNWKSDVTAIYLAGVYELYKQEPEARKLISKLKLNDPQESDYEYYTDQFYRDSVYLDLVSRHFKPQLNEVTSDQLSKYIAPIKSGSYNTISSSMAILGMDSYVAAVQAQGALATVDVSVLLDKQKAFIPAALTGDVIRSHALDLNAIKVKIKNPSEAPQFYQVLQSGFDRVMPSKDEREGLEVLRTITDLDDKNIEKAKVGETYAVHLNFRALKKAQGQVAIVDMLPAGFEVVLDRNQHDAEPEGKSNESEMPTIDEEAPPPGHEGEREGEEDGARLFNWFIPSAFAADSSREPASTRLSGSEEGWQPDYLDVREDRVILYGRVTTDTMGFTYHVKAVNSGTFNVPAVYGENMYDRTVHAHSAASKITVEGIK